MWVERHSESTHQDLAQQKKTFVLQGSKLNHSVQSQSLRNNTMLEVFLTEPNYWLPTLRGTAS